MEFEKFKKELIVVLKNNLPEKFNLEVRETYKENDTKMTGISIMKEGCDGGCVIYAENLYEAYRNGSSIEEITKNTLSEVLDSDIYSINWNTFTKEDILSHTTFRMANKYTNQLRLSDVPTRDVPGMTDIVIYPVYEVNVGTRYGTVLVTNSMLESNHISVAEIHSAAEANTERRMAIMPLEDRLRGIMDVDAMPMGFESPFLVTYDREAMGDEASVLGAPKVLASLKEPYYVIPSSTHELLFLPKYFTADNSRLLQLISEVNTGMLEETDVLSNNLYELENGKFKTVEVTATATA